MIKNCPKDGHGIICPHFECMDCKHAVIIDLDEFDCVVICGDAESEVLEGAEWLE